MLNVDTKKPDRPGAQETCAGVGELSVDGVEDGAQEDTILQANVDERRRLCLVDTSIEHIGDAYGGGRRGKSLKTDCFEGALRIERHDTDRLILTTYSLQTGQYRGIETVL